jgi:lipoprotein-anchoring transpeptidase ErfK/SrfK
MENKIVTLTSLLLLAGGAWAQVREPVPPLSNVVLQVALDQHGFSVGLIDDKSGGRTQGALADFKQARGIAKEKDLQAALALDKIPTFQNYTITQADFDQVGEAPLDWVEAARVPRMAFRSLPEAFSERFHVAEDYLSLLNPEITDWSSTNILGKSISVPNIPPRENLGQAASIAVDYRRFRLRALDAQGKIMASFPCSMAMAGKTVPSGDLKVTVFAQNPTYTFDPVNYPESARAQEIGQRLIIPAGPNTPVGVYWIGLNLPGFGIHGTPHPETIGCRESHGCFRLTNWDIVRLSKMLASGTPVKVTGLAP